MTALVEAAKSHRAKVTIFRGTLASGATVAWATAAVEAADGVLAPRLLGVSRARNGISEAHGGLPERASVEIQLADQDGGLTPLFLGTASGQAVDEFTGDGLLNLRGQVFAGYLDEDDVLHEAAISPPLVVAGSPRRSDDGTITVPLAADEEPLLGKPRGIVRLRQLVDAVVVEDGDRFSLMGVDNGPATETDWAPVAARLAGVQDRERVVPYYYGPRPIPLITTGDETGARWFAFVSRHRPTLSDAGYWLLSHIVDGERQALIGAVSRMRSHLWSVRVQYEDDAYQLATAWVVVVELSPLQVGGLTEERDLWIEAPASNPMSWSEEGPQTPTEIARRVLVDHAGAGADAIDATSFDRALDSLPVEGASCVAVAGEGSVGELVGSILAPWPVGWWVGLDGRVHVAILGQFSQIDRSEAAAALPELRDCDVLGGFTEEVPVEAGRRGAAVADVLLEWSDEQARIWGASALPKRIPSNASLPIADVQDFAVTAGCLRPDRVADAVAAYGLRAAWPAKRIRFHSHDWLATLERGRLLRLTYAGGTGYSRRLVRLEATDLDEKGEHAIVRLEDLGASEGGREAAFDAIAPWVYVAAIGVSQWISLTAGSSLVTVAAGLIGPDAEGCHLCVPGAAHEENRRIARRISKVHSATQIQVEFPFAVTEDIYGSPTGTAPLATAWHILHSQESISDNADKLTAANEDAGEFRDGTPGFRVGAG